MTTMDRRAFLRRGALFVPAAALAIEEAKSGLVTGWVRRFFPGFGPGTLRAPVYPPGGNDFAALSRVLREVYEPLIAAELTRDSAIMELFDPVPAPATGRGMYIPLIRG